MWIFRLRTVEVICAVSLSYPLLFIFCSPFAYVTYIYEFLRSMLLQFHSSIIIKPKSIYLALKMKISKAKSYFIFDFSLYSVKCLIAGNIELTGTYLFIISILFKDPAEVWVRTPTMTRGRLRNSESHTPTARPDGATALPPRRLSCDRLGFFREQRQLSSGTGRSYHPHFSRESTN